MYFFPLKLYILYFYTLKLLYYTSLLYIFYSIAYKLMRSSLESYSHNKNWQKINPFKILASIFNPVIHNFKKKKIEIILILYYFSYEFSLFVNIADIKKWMDYHVSK